MFIVLEGIDGSGKTTIARWLVSWLRKNGISAHYTHEPMVKDIELKFKQNLPDKIDPEIYNAALVSLYTTDRRQHVDLIINPLLKKGKTVVCDRYYFSTAAYQGVHFDPLSIMKLNSEFPAPDITFYLQIPASVAAQRLAVKQEMIPSDYYIKHILYNYEILSEHYPMVIIDATKDKEKVFEQIKKHLIEKINEIKIENKEKITLTTKINKSAGAITV